MKILDFLEPLVTEETVKLYHNTDEKYLFCVDLLRDYNLPDDVMHVDFLEILINDYKAEV